MTSNDRPERLLRALDDLLTELNGDGSGHPGWRVEPNLAVSPGGPGDSLEPVDGSPAGTGESPITTRETDEGLLVVAELPGVVEVELSTDLDREVGVLTLGVDGEVVDRIPLDDGQWTITDVAFNDGVFEVTLMAE